MLPQACGKENKLFKNLTPYCEFLALLAANSWRRNPNFPLARAENSVIAPLLVVAVSVVSDAGEDGEGGGSVNRYALSMRMIWLKLGLMLGSSTQHDCTINARSAGMSPGILGLSCCILRP